MAEFVNFASGTITDSPLTVGATSINSAAFATVLPAIAAPRTMSIVLDPDGDDGIPEIVTVTAHTAAATVVTVTRGQQTSLGGSAARSHTAGTVWVLAATALDLNRGAGDPGDLKAGIWSTPPDGWLLMGQSIITADVTYPALWAVVPSSWKSGTTLNLPSMDGRAMLGGGTLGATGGANTRTLATANLPAHTHAVDHNHASATTGSGGAAHVHAVDHNHASATTGAASATAHTHDIDHNHPSATTASGGDHTHTVAAINTAAGFTTGNLARGGGGTNTTFPTSEDGAHTHTLDLPVTSGLVSGSGGAAHTHSIDLAAYTGLSGNASATAHTHTVDLAAYTGVSGSAGSGTAVDTTPSHLRINVAIKT
jgi:microcystin-dependent protein